MRPAKLLEFPSIWVLGVAVVSATITSLAVSDQAWAFFSWTEGLAGYLNGLHRRLEPIVLQGCDPRTIRAIAAGGLLTIGATAGSTVAAILAMLDYANPAYRPRKPAPAMFRGFVMAKGSICLVFAAAIAWSLWFYDGSLPQMQMVDCARLRGADYFIAKAVLLSAISQYLLFAGLRALIRVARAM